MAALAEHTKTEDPPITSSDEPIPDANDNTPNDSEHKSSVEMESKEQQPVKPGLAKNIKLFLVDPERFIVQWNAPKKLGHPLPLMYNIMINDHLFENVLSQRGRKQKPNRVLVTNCDVDELYKVGIDTLNEKVSGKKSTFHSIKTILRPSVMTELTMNDGVIRWKPPMYGLFVVSV